MEPRSPHAHRRYDDLVEAAARSMVCLDFDGVLAPIVDDPAEAHIHPEGPDILVELARRVRAVAVVTGRPARQAVSLGDLDTVGGRIAEEGGDFFVLGQYGHERWSAHDRRVLSPRPPRGLATMVAELPDLLRRHGMNEAFLEQKSLSVAVHTRRMDEPREALERLRPVLARAAADHGLVLEPGRMVIEIRAPGMDKGQAVRALKSQLRADGVLYAGDDLGDVEAFEAIAALRRGGMVGVLVYSASQEQPALAELADFVVDGPDGVMKLLHGFVDDVAAAGLTR